MLAGVISDGRPGVGQAALRAARACGLRAGTGPAPPAADLASRVRTNVLAADGTLVLLAWPSDVRGSALQALAAGADSGRPCVIAGIDAPEVMAATADWVRDYVRDGILHVAGPREARSPGVTAAAEAWLAGLFRLIGHPARTARLQSA